MVLAIIAAYMVAEPRFGALAVHRHDRRRLHPCRPHQHVGAGDDREGGGAPPQQVVADGDGRRRRRPGSRSKPSTISVPCRSSAPRSCSAWGRRAASNAECARDLVVGRQRVGHADVHCKHQDEPRRGPSRGPVRAGRSSDCRRDGHRRLHHHRRAVLRAGRARAARAGGHPVIRSRSGGAPAASAAASPTLPRSSSS